MPLPMTMMKSNRRERGNRRKTAAAAAGVSARRRQMPIAATCSRVLGVLSATGGGTKEGLRRGFINSAMCLTFVD